MLGDDAEDDVVPRQTDGSLGRMDQSRPRSSKLQKAPLEIFSFPFSITTEISALNARLHDRHGMICAGGPYVGILSVCYEVSRGNACR